MPVQPCFKGFAMASLLQAARASWGEGEVDRVLAEKGSSALNGTLACVDPKTWYPAEAHLELLDVLYRHACREHRPAFEAVGHMAMGSDMQLLYRLLLKVFSPSYALTRSKLVMRAYSNYGDVEVLEQTPVSGVIQLRLDPCNEAFWIALAGGLRAVLEHAGAERVVAEAQPGSSPQVCRYALSWA